MSCSYVLTLITDGMRSVRAFHFDKAAASVLTTCVSSACGSDETWTSQNLLWGKATFLSHPADFLRRKANAEYLRIVRQFLVASAATDVSRRGLAPCRWLPWSPATSSWAPASETLSSSSTRRNSRRSFRRRRQRRTKISWKWRRRIKINRYVWYI